MIYPAADPPRTRGMVVHTSGHDFSFQTEHPHEAPG